MPSQRDGRGSADPHGAWSAVSAAFAALGRVFLCTDADLHVLHVSELLDSLFGAGTAVSLEGQPLDRVFDAELFGPSGTLRRALLDGQRREGWRASLQLGDERHVVSLSAAPFPRELYAACDPRIAFVIAFRPAEIDRGEGLGSPATLGRLIARSPAMQRVFALIDNLRHSDATVLITGESGTGKELVARAVHDHSPRRGGPFVAVNCGALPADLLESEMFGHVRGAFTGAVRDRVGRFELASDGTLFLDEVGDLPLSLQVKLLRVLQDGRFERLGESHTRASRARVIAATHVDLPTAVRDGAFRDDLFFRLRVVPVHLPPLRERREDIAPIADSLLARVNARHGRALRLSPDALRGLLRHDWPGNVRELENALEYAVAVCRGQTILPEDLPSFTAPMVNAPVMEPGRSAPPSEEFSPPPPGDLRQALEAHQWRRDQTARALGISRVTLWRRMRNAGLLAEKHQRFSDATP